MRKILTIFERNWDGDRKIVPKLIVDFDFSSAIATEKLDGTNVRITVRNGEAVRIEKRRNPSKVQKQKGIMNPWYVDADEFASQDKWIFDAVKNTTLKEIPDGEWSAEAIGKNIQGNPLNLERNELFFFSIPEWREQIILEDAPTDFDEIQEYLSTQKSKIGKDCLMEGIVWHHPSGNMVKIKRKDFRDTILKRV